MHEEHEWNGGLCGGCCGGSCGSCLGSWFCPCFMLGRASSRQHAFPAEETGSCNGSCGIFCLASVVGLACIPVCMKRSEIRSAHRIKGSSCGDFMASWCCMPCSIAQMNSELKSRAKAVNAAPNAGYARQQAGMKYQRQ
ncbi:hypothetical protein AMS68_006600 [Peltaster fructicola]|uniref:PLAC8-domain-containing protein n=1 Tax=Peltaster fructicola TaxID=286661 RepID=A0A6H0Y235_9PEZI|nr:hypothetical protein AMS68_006600 [Peltaster fructicola]